MYKFLFCLSFSFFSALSFAQIKFVPGTITTNSGKNLECLIKNSSFINNPTEIKYKIKGQSGIKTKTIKEIKGFEIPGVGKYLKEKVDIDRTSSSTNNLSGKIGPQFQKEELLLKLLVEGNTSLYQYKDRGLERYFYKTPEQEIKQLIYRKYKNENNKIVVDYSYRNQLYQNVNCEKWDAENLAFVEYKEDNLVDFFIGDNDCKNAPFHHYEKLSDNLSLNLNIRPGINSVYTRVATNFDVPERYEFDRGNHFRIGAELEIIERANRKKWAIILEPTYQIYKATSNTTEDFATIDYMSLEIPFGLRHYFHLSDKSKIFIDLNITLFDLSADSYIRFPVSTRDLTLLTGGNLGCGVGYKFNDRFSLQVRTHSGRSIIAIAEFVSSRYSHSSLIFGYTLL